MILSTASSNSAMPTRSLFLRTARSAASLTILARSRPHHAGCHVGEPLHVELRDGLDLFEVNPEDLFAPDLVGPVDQDVAVKAARPQERGVEDFGPVGCGHEDDSDFGVETVHLHQELV